MTANLLNIVESIILSEATRNEILALIKKDFDTCSKKYFKSKVGKYPYPTFKIQAGLRRRGGDYTPSNNTIRIDLDKTIDPSVRKSIIYHETIHYFQTKGGTDFKRDEFKASGYHGDDFKRAMRRINKGEGNEIVKITTSWDDHRIKKAGKDFYVYIIEGKNTIYAGWSPTLNKTILNFLAEEMRINYEIRHTTSIKIDPYNRAYYFKTDYINFKKCAQIRTPKNPMMSFYDTPDKQKIIKQRLRQVPLKNRIDINFNTEISTIET